MNILIILGTKYLYFIETILAVIFFFLQIRSKQKLIVVLSFIFFSLTYIVAKVITFLHLDSRPFVVEHFTPLISRAPDNGFSSDHMLLISVIASIIFIYNGKLGIIAWVVTFIIGTSRDLAGVHHWADIIGSAVITVSMLWLVKTYVLLNVSKTKFYKLYFENKFAL